MKKRNIVLCISMLIISIFFMTSCSATSTTTTGNSQTTSKTTSKTTSTSTSTVPATTSITSGNSISIENFKFVPDTLTIKAGTTVIWTNNDSVTHNIKSADFNSPSIDAGKTYEFKFDKVGTYDYSCGIHPSMTGKIIVQ